MGLDRTGMIFGVDLLEVVYGHTGIDLCGIKGGMAEHLLKVSDRGTVSEHVGGTGVAESMRGYIPFDLCNVGIVFDDLPYASFAYLMALIV